MGAATKSAVDVVTDHAQDERFWWVFFLAPISFAATLALVCALAP